MLGLEVNKKKYYNEISQKEHTIDITTMAEINHYLIINHLLS